MNEIKCLNCHENAQELYLESQYHIHLTNKKYFLTVIPRKNRMQVTKSDNGRYAPSIKVCYCQNCNLVWFYTDEKYRFK